MKVRVSLSAFLAFPLLAGTVVVGTAQNSNHATVDSANLAARTRLLDGDTFFCAAARRLEQRAGRVGDLGRAG
jgi:hypothetical protein